MRRAALLRLGLGATVLLGPHLAIAQYGRADPFEEAQPLGPARRSEAVPVVFRTVRDVPLPGPLPDGGPRLLDGEVAVPVAGGVALLATGGSDRARIVTGAAAPPPERFAPADEVVDAEGRRRYSPLPDGRLLAEKRCARCRRGWKRDWRLRVPGNIVAVPAVHAERLSVGATNNRVYSVKRRNGHRVWSTDVGGRVSRPPVLWESATGIGAIGPPPDTPVPDAILVVPDDGSAILALDAASGRPLAKFELSEGRFVGVPLVTDDGSIWVARQLYQRSEASLLRLELRSAEPSSVSR